MKKRKNIRIRYVFAVVSLVYLMILACDTVINESRISNNVPGFKLGLFFIAGVIIGRELKIWVETRKD